MKVGDHPPPLTIRRGDEIEAVEFAFRNIKSVNSVDNLNAALENNTSPRVNENNIVEDPFDT